MKVISSVTFKPYAAACSNQKVQRSPSISLALKLKAIFQMQASNHKALIKLCIVIILFGGLFFIFSFKAFYWWSLWKPAELSISRLCIELKPFCEHCSSNKAWVQRRKSLWDVFKENPSFSESVSQLSHLGGSFLSKNFLDEVPPDQLQ